MYGFAYAQMQDQASYVLENLFKSVGRSAEVEGPACTPSLVKCFESDQTTHLFRIPEVAYEKFATLSDDDQSRYHGFADGLNAYVTDHPEAVPEWARDAGTITAQDVLASVEWRFVMAQLNRASGAFKNFNTGPPPIGILGASSGTSGTPSSIDNGNGRFIDLFDDPAYKIEMNASNMFVIDGTKTESGEPILDSDPHLAYEGDTQWYQAQVSYPGVSVEGSTFRGLPAIGIGYNGHVAWGHTSNQGAIHEQDAYKETLASGAPNSYEYGSESKSMTLRTVDIKVQTSPGSFSTIPVTFRYTIHGPVVTDPPAGLDGVQPAPGTSLAGTVTASQYEQVGLASEMWRQAESTNLDEFKQAMSDVQLSQFNTMAADSDGNIFYVGQSRSGVLSDSPHVDFSNGWLDGSVPNNTWISSDPEKPWTGVIPFNELPQAENPASGFYENANNTPWSTAPGQITIDDVPYYMQLGNDGTRSRRQRELLTAATNLNLADVNKIAFDAFIEFAPTLKDLLDSTAAQPAASQKVKDGSALLDAWDNVADRDSVAFPLFTAWVRGLDKKKLGHSFPEQGNVNPQQASAPYPDGLVDQPGGYTAAQMTEAGRAMEAAYDAMMAAYGSISVRSGDVHTMDWGDFHSPIGGGTEDAPALWMTGCKKGYPANVLVAFPCSAANGSGYMMNVDFGDESMYSSKPASASDDSTSPFYTVNAEDFANRAFRKFPITDSEVNTEKTSETDLEIDTPITSVFKDMTSPTINCTVQTDPKFAGQRWCGGNSSRVATFDGTPIDVNVAFPPAPSEGNDGDYPVIGLFHGWGGAKDPFQGSPQRWLSRGYAVFTMSDRGWAESCGFPTSRQNLPSWANCDKGNIQLMDQRTDIRDPQYLIGELVDEGVVDPQRIAAIGGSYGGGMSSSLAMLKDRMVMPDGSLVPWKSPHGTPMKLAAAMPGNFWSDLANSLVPNGHQLDYVADSPYFGPNDDLPVGVEKWAHVNGLYDTTQKPPANPRGNPGQLLTDWRDLLNGPGPYGTPTFRGIIDEMTSHHSPYYIDDSEPPAPMFMKNGWNDDLFPADEAIRLFNKLRTDHPGAPIGMALADVGHARGQGKVDALDAIDVLMDAWADYYVKNEGSKPAGGVYTFSFTCPDTAASDGPYHYDSWADVAAGEVRLDGGATQTVAPTGSKNGPDFQRSSPCTQVDATDNPASANYRTQPAPADGYTVAGSATISADLVTGGPSDQLAARLLDVGPDGKEMLVQRGLLRPMAGTGSIHNLFQLHPNFWHVDEGHVLKLELLADDPPYSHVNVGSPDDAAQHPISVSNLDLRIPVAESPGTADGMVQAPAPKQLPPGYILARDFVSPPVAEPTLTLAPSSHAFGARNVDAGPTDPQTFTVTADGDGILEIGTVALAGPARGDFKLESEDCSSKSLAQGERCTISVSFDPVSAGEKQASVAISSNAASSPDLAQLTGDGIAQPTTCPKGQTGTPPNCINIPVTKPGKLSKLKLKAPKKVKSGKKFKVKVKVSNIGGTNLTNVRICLKTQKKFIKGTGKRCRVLSNLAAGKTKMVKFKLKTKRFRNKKRTKLKAIVSKNGKVLRKNHVTVLK